MDYEIFIKYCNYKYYSIYYNGKCENMKLFLVIMNKDTLKYFTRYFNTEFEMDTYKRKIKYVKNLFVIEDSRDTIYDYEK